MADFLSCEPKKESLAHILWVIYEQLPALKDSMPEAQHKEKMDTAWRRYFNRHPQSTRMPVYRWREFREFIAMEECVDRAQEFLLAGDMSGYCTHMEGAFRKFFKIKNAQLADGPIHPKLRAPGAPADWKRTAVATQTSPSLATAEVQVQLAPIEHRATQVNAKESPAQTVWDTFKVPALNEVAKLPEPFRSLRPEVFIQAEFLNGGFRSYFDRILRTLDKAPSVMERIRLENAAKKLIQEAIDSVGLGRRFASPAAKVAQLKSAALRRSKSYRGQARSLLAMLHSRLCHRMALKRSRRSVLKPRPTLAKPSASKILIGGRSIAELKKLAAARKQQVQVDGWASASVDIPQPMFAHLEKCLLKSAELSRTPKMIRNGAATYRIWSEGVARRFFAQADVTQHEFCFNAKQGRFFKPVISKAWPLLLRYSGPTKSSLKIQLYYSIS